MEGRQSEASNHARQRQHDRSICVHDFHYLIKPWNSSFARCANAPSICRPRACWRRARVSALLVAWISRQPQEIIFGEAFSLVQCVAFRNPANRKPDRKCEVAIQLAENSVKCQRDCVCRTFFQLELAIERRLECLARIRCTNRNPKFLSE